MHEIRNNPNHFLLSKNTERNLLIVKPVHCEIIANLTVTVQGANLLIKSTKPGYPDTKPLSADFWYRHRMRFPEEFKAPKYMKINAMIFCGFVPGNALGEGPRIWILS